MATHKDDSSADGLSSVGDQAWEEIDETSTYSENGTSSLSRQLTPMSEHPEPFEFGVASFMSNNTSSDDRMLETPESHEDSNETPQQEQLFTPTASNLRSHMWGNTDKVACGFSNESIRSQRLGYIKLDEPSEHDPWKQSTLLSQHLFDLTRKEVLMARNKLNIDRSALDAHLKVVCGKEALRSSPTFEILYFGPREMRSPLIEKIGAILTTRSGSLATDKTENNFSRITAVPVSEFHSDASPDIVLIDSAGKDMTVTRCLNASFLEQKDDAAISLSLDSGCAITSRRTWHGGFAIKGEFRVPQLALVYVSDQETGAERIARETLTLFLARHNISFLTVSSSFAAAIDPELLVDPTLPHLTVQEPGQHEILYLLPIDLATFQAMDAGQLNRSIAHSIYGPPAPDWIATEGIRQVLKSLFSNACSQVNDSAHKAQKDTNDFVDGFPGSLKTLWFGWIAQIRGRPTYYTASLVLLLFMQIVVWILQPSIMMNRSDVTPQAFDALKAGTSNIWISQTAAPVARLTEQKSHQRKDELSLRDMGDVANILQNAVPKRSGDKKACRASVIGDSHVIAVIDDYDKTPLTRSNSRIHFRVQRDNSPIVHDVSRISDDVYVIELPIEDAYGKVNISAWTNKASKINETMEVDFGTPWLKISAWLRSAQAMNGKAHENLITVKSALTEVIKKANGRITNHLHEATKAMSDAAKDAEQARIAATRRAQKAVQKHYNRASKLVQDDKSRAVRQAEKARSQASTSRSKASHKAQDKRNRAKEDRKKSADSAAEQYRRAVETWKERVSESYQANKRQAALIAQQLEEKRSRFNQELAHKRESLDRYLEARMRQAELQISQHVKRTASTISSARPDRAIQRFRSQHLRSFEKKLLHAWWKVNDKPPQKDSKEELYDDAL